LRARLDNHRSEHCTDVLLICDPQRRGTQRKKGNPTLFRIVAGPAAESHVQLFHCEIPWLVRYLGLVKQPHEIKRQSFVSLLALLIGVGFGASSASGQASSGSRANLPSAQNPKASPQSQAKFALPRCPSAGLPPARTAFRPLLYSQSHSLVECESAFAQGAKRCRRLLPLSKQENTSQARKPQAGVFRAAPRADARGPRCASLSSVAERADMSGRQRGLKPGERRVLAARGPTDGDRAPARRE
jgi:hypothetical protein